MIKKDLRWDTVLAVCTLSAIPLYISGHFFNLGRLSSFGLSVDPFNKSVYDILISSVMVLQYLLSDLSGANSSSSLYVFSISFIFFHTIGLPFVFYTIIKSQRIDLSEINFKKFFNVPRSFHSYFIISLVIFVLGFLLPFSSYSYGCKLGVVQRISSPKITCKNHYEIYSVYSLENKLIADGFLITSSNTSIAIWNGTQTEVFPLTEVKLKINICNV